MLYHEARRGWIHWKNVNSMPWKWIYKTTAGFQIHPFRCKAKFYIFKWNILKNNITIYPWKSESYRWHTKGCEKQIDLGNIKVDIKSILGLTQTVKTPINRYCHNNKLVKLPERNITNCTSLTFGVQIMQNKIIYFSMLFHYFLFWPAELV